jgi:hypothetical protein
MYIIIDSTGFKITNKEEWMDEKYNRKKKGCFKINLTIDANSFNIVSLSITDEKVHDSRKFRRIIDQF